MRDVVFVDVETTGLSPKSSVVEVAAYRTKPSEMFDMIRDDVKVWRIMPPEDCYVEEKALEINGFSRELWNGSPSFEEVTKELAEVLHDSILAGWNVKFDLGMLEGEFRRLGLERMPWHYHALDVMTFMMPLYFNEQIESLSLHAACNYFGVSNRGEHRALADVMRTLEVFHKLSVLYGFHKDEETQFVPQRESEPHQVSEPCTCGECERCTFYEKRGEK